MSAHIFSRLLGAWFAFVLPSFRTFQAIHHRSALNPNSEHDIERWTKYWSVIGLVVAAEYTVEWLICWFPFYWEIKTLFLLFLSLPQIQGSTFVFDTYIAPLLIKHDAEIEGHINSAQSNVVAWAQARISSLLDIVYSLLGKARAQADAQSVDPTQAASSQRASPLKGATDAVWGLWSSYGSPYLARVSNPRSAQHAQPQSTARSGTPSGSSTAVPTIASLYPRTSFAQDSQTSLPITPNEVHKQQNPEGTHAPPTFPVPQHFAD